MAEEVKPPIMERKLYEIAKEYDISYEKAKELANEWAKGYRKGIAKAIGVEPEDVDIKKRWKEEWFEDWLEAFLGHSPGLDQMMSAYARAGGESYGRTRARLSEVV